MSATTSRISAQEIHVSGDHEWARVRLEEEIGLVTILSSFGDWAYWWPPSVRAGRSLPAFLSRVNIGYAGRKFMGSDLDVYDAAATYDGIKKMILEDRRDGRTNKSETRAEWELLEILDERGFDYWAWETEIVDPSEDRRTKMSETWVAFWERLWEPLIKPELCRLAGRNA